MYISRIVFQVKSDQKEVFEATAQVAAKAALDMSGCQTFMMLASPYESGQYVLYEEWETAEQADSFKQSKVRNESVAKLVPAMAAAPQAVEFEAMRKS